MLGTGKKGVLRSTQIYVEKSFLQDNLYFFLLNCQYILHLKPLGVHPNVM